GRLDGAHACRRASDRCGDDDDDGYGSGQAGRPGRGRRRREERMRQGLADRQVLNPSTTPVAPMIAALTLDLDDTLWPIAPIMARCEQVLHDYLAQHAPIVATRFPVPSMRALRERIFAEQPELAHDYAALRRLSIERAFDECGHVSPGVIDDAYTLFYATRNEVELYADVAEALPAIARRHR